MNTLKVLIVEDDLHWQEEFEEKILQLGHQVSKIVDNASDACDYLKSHNVDLIFLDIHLRDEFEGGYRVMEFLNERTTKKTLDDFANKSFSQIPCIFLSGIKDDVTLDKVCNFIHPMNYKKKKEMESLADYKRAINFAMNQVDWFNMWQDDDESFYISPVNSQTIYRIFHREILWIESDGKYAHLHIKTNTDNKYMPIEFKLRNGFSKFKEGGEFHFKGLIQIHKSFIVNKTNIRLELKRRLYFDDNGNLRPTYPHSYIKYSDGFDSTLLR